MGRTTAPWRLAGLLMVVAPRPAAAHVKWFCTIADGTAPPVALSQVLSPVFLAWGATFLALVFMGSVADGWVARLWPRALSTRGRLQGGEALLLRVAMGVYCLALAGHMAVVPWGHGAAILTPELLHNDRWITGLQVLTGIAMLWQRTCGVAAVAMAALLVVGVAQYGVFHMTDYMYFVGVAAYLALTPQRMARWRHWRMPLLSAGLSFALMWTAVEKFLYPAWTAQVLAVHPDIGAGFPVSEVVVIAGFVEFSLAFYLMAGRGLLRVAAAALIVVFVSAVPEFGMLDSVGHLPIVAILLAMILHGTTPLQEVRGRVLGGPVLSAAAVCGVYVATLCVMAGMYYGLQRLAV